MSDETPTRRRKSDYEPEAISRAELRDILEDVNKTLITKTFELVGLDISDEDARADVRKDFSWLRDVRVASGKASDALTKAGFAAVAGGILASLWAGFKIKFGGG
jgi:methionine synthase II (cobalamin-independent)